MEERKGGKYLRLDKENEVISFYDASGWEKKEFSSKTEMLDFCCTRISIGYKVQ